MTGDAALPAGVSPAERAEQVRQARARLKILDAIVLGQERFAEVSQVIAEATDKRAAVAAISVLLSVSNVGARAISELPWHRLTADAWRQAREDRDDVIAYLQALRT